MHHKGNPGVNVCSSNYTNFDWVCLLCPLSDTGSEESQQAEQGQEQKPRLWQGTPAFFVFQREAACIK